MQAVPLSPRIETAPTPQVSGGDVIGNHASVTVVLMSCHRGITRVMPLAQVSVVDRWHGVVQGALASMPWALPGGDVTV